MQDIDQRRYIGDTETSKEDRTVQEQGIAWMIAGGTHDDSPEDHRQREFRRVLAASQPARPGLRQRLAGLITGRASGSAAATSTDCCPA